MYYHQVKSAALTASQNSALGSWSGIDPNAALHEEIGEEHSDDVNQMHAGPIDHRNVHSILTAPHDSSGRVGSKSEWSFAPAAAPKFMASAAWAGSRAAGAVDVLGGGGLDGGGCGVGMRSGGSEWTGAEGTGQGEVRSGWLLKKAESSWGWRRRWFVLHPGRLTYQVRSPSCALSCVGCVGWGCAAEDVGWQATPDGTGVVKTIPLHDPRPCSASGGALGRLETAGVEALGPDLEFRLHSFGRHVPLPHPHPLAHARSQPDGPASVGTPRLRPARLLAGSSRAACEGWGPCRAVGGGKWFGSGPCTKATHRY